MFLVNYVNQLNINNNSMSKLTFVFFCLLVITLEVLLLNFLMSIVFKISFGSIPIQLVIISCTFAAYLGCIFYIRKHDFAHGRIYKVYQVINSSLFGLKNYFKVLLIFMIIRLLWVPIMNLVIVIIFISIFMKYIRGII